MQERDKKGTKKQERNRKKITIINYNPELNHIKNYIVLINNILQPKMKNAKMDKTAKSTVSYLQEMIFKIKTKLC